MPLAKPRHVLFFEIGDQGHVASHTDALVAASNGDQTGLTCTFALRNALYEKLLPETRSIFESGGRIRFRGLSDTDVAECRRGNGFKQGPRRWRTAVKIAETISADHIFFYQMDSALFGAFASPFLARIPFSGILFHPEMHLCLKRRPKSLKRFLSQAVFYTAVLSLRNLERVWSLDPIFPEFAARWLPFGRKIHFLPEISIPLPDPGDVPARKDQRTTYLLYGILKRRKGVMNLLTALDAVPAAAQKKMRIVLAGAVAAELESVLPQALAALKQSSPELDIVTHFRFLDEADLTRLIIDCDVVLAPYVGHVGSSGVVYTAARAGKPLLATDEALLGEIVERYKLGVTADPLSVTALSGALERLLDADVRNDMVKGSARSEYLAVNAPSFAELVVFGLVARD
jgi:glycosyltransferase involved in cell wall biosynthesis